MKDCCCNPEDGHIEGYRPPADQVPDMVERVARAISRATSVDLHGGKLTDYAADDWRDFEGEARAAIAALQAVPASGELVGKVLREALAFVEEIERREDTHYLVGGHITDAIAALKGEE